MKSYKMSALSQDEQDKLLLRPIIQSNDIMARVKPIVDGVRERGDAALKELTAKFDGVKLDQTVISAPFSPESMVLDDKTRHAIDQAYDNIQKFHAAQLQEKPLVVETMPGVVCTRFARAIERVGLYVPGGTAVLPSTTLMLGIPAAVAGCREIVIATPPRKDGSIVPEVVYVAHKVGASKILAAGGAQAVAAMAYGTETCPKVDKICGPGNQYVTAAKMLTQIDSSSLVSIDMPAGPSELLVIADMTSIPAYVASDLLSQAEHGTDSQVVLVAVNLTPEHLAAIEDQVHEQASRLPRVDIVRESIPKSFIIQVDTMQDAMKFSNAYAPEHLILHLEHADQHVASVNNAGSVFVGHWSPESCGDYASGTNHTLPTYGYARMYSGVNTDTFLKHITSQQLTREGLDSIGDTVMRLAEIEGLEAHRNAVAVRIKDIRGL
ncbi:trifunctional histidinol dehydrogenase [Mortierella sp. GBA43]|nr:trifunctional histidinol dehydrogenase [Mortierella sp. GBA43]